MWGSGPVLACYHFYFFIVIFWIADEYRLPGGWSIDISLESGIKETFSVIDVVLNQHIVQLANTAGHTSRKIQQQYTVISRQRFL